MVHASGRPGPGGSFLFTAPCNTGVEMPIDPDHVSPSIKLIDVQPALPSERFLVAEPPDAEAVPPHVARLRASLRETLDASPVWSWESLVRTGLAREA